MLAGLSAALPTLAFAQTLPDLGGRTIVAVTENAYVPLNFADPRTGEWIGLEYDLVNDIAASQRPGGVAPLGLGRDDPRASAMASTTLPSTASRSIPSAPR